MRASRRMYSPSHLHTTTVGHKGNQFCLLPMHHGRQERVRDLPTRRQHACEASKRRQQLTSMRTSSDSHRVSTAVRCARALDSRRRGILATCPVCAGQTIQAARAKTAGGPHIAVPLVKQIHRAASPAQRRLLARCSSGATRWVARSRTLTGIVCTLPGQSVAPSPEATARLTGCRAKATAHQRRPPHVSRLRSGKDVDDES